MRIKWILIFFLMWWILFSGIDQCWGSQNSVYVWDPDPTPLTGPIWSETLQEWNVPYAYETEDLPSYSDLIAYQLLIVSLGVFPNNHVLSFEEFLTIATYIENGGAVYLEGGDVWYYDPWVSLRELFGIEGVSGGGFERVRTVEGITDTFTEEMAFSYYGENRYINELSPIENGFAILENIDPYFYVMIANNADTYRTIGSSIELGGLRGETPIRVLLGKILDFFQIREFLPAPYHLTASVQVQPEGYDIHLEWIPPVTTDTLLFYNVYMREVEMEFYHLGITEQPSYTHHVSDATILEYYVTSLYTLGESDSSNVMQVSLLQDIPDDFMISIPTTFHLNQNVPNPFNPQTTISFAIPQTEHVHLTIYNIKGERIKNLLDQPFTVGQYAVQWDGTDERGRNAASGTYLYVMQAGEYQAVQKMILLR